MNGGPMKIFSIAAVLTGLVLVSMSLKRRKQSTSLFALSGLSGLQALSDEDRRYAIDDLMNDLD